MFPLITFYVLVTHQPAIIELVRGSDKFASLIQSTNDDVRKYFAKSIAYLSLRNGKDYGNARESV